jgi:glycosyltransferase involved in cell wall biosynthesis
VDITVIIPTIPARAPLLDRALASIAAQTLPPVHVLTHLDDQGWGAARTRDHLLTQVTTPWVAPLDDDDEFLPDHLAGLRACIEETGTDLAYAWYEIVGPAGQVEQWRDPHTRWESAWDADPGRQAPTTFLATTTLLRRVGGWTNHGTWDPTTARLDATGNRVGEDTLLIHRAAATGARIVHHPARTYRWHHHQSCGGNTSGLPAR